MVENTSSKPKTVERSIGMQMNPNHGAGWESLANAIIEKAASDYRGALRYIYGCPYPRNGNESSQKHTALGHAKECERFFASEWFETLTAADGGEIARRIREEIREEVG